MIFKSLLSKQFVMAVKVANIGAKIEILQGQ